MDPLRTPNSVNIPLPSSILRSHSTTFQEQYALITPPPELQYRDAAPEPQNGAADCSSAAQSASQAIQQANQQASQSIQQASQQASQSIQQATQQATRDVQMAQQSASLGIQQCSNQLSQSIADASRSITSIQSSASSALSSLQSSANQALASVNGQISSAQASAASAQSVLKAAVAAATGSAAAAGSSFLAAAAKATQGAQASVSSIGAAASSQVAQSSQQANVSQTVAITATEAALAIVGSIIASTLITMLVYFLVIRHKKLVKRRSLDERSLGFQSDPKPPESQANTPFPREEPHNRNPFNDSSTSLPLPTEEENKELRSSIVKTTTVKWNPSNPPKAPPITSVLTLQNSFSPFGPISLPDHDTSLPLGGQLRSPLQSTYPLTHKMSKQPLKSEITQLAPAVKPATFTAKKTPFIAAKTTVTPIPKRAVTIKVIAPKSESVKTQTTRRKSEASAWTDQRAEQDPDMSPPRARIQQPEMRLPEPVRSVRNTAEWLASPSRFADERTPAGLPSSPRQSSEIIGNAR